MFLNGRTSISVEIPLYNIKKFPGLNFMLLQTATMLSPLPIFVLKNA